MMDLLKLQGSNVVLFLLATAVLSSCSWGGDRVVRNEKSGAALGTTYSIIYLDQKTLNLETEFDSVFRVINHSLSTYIPTSDISKINAGDTTIVVDAMFTDVFDLSKDIHEKTNGYFDPTVGVLVNAWGFGPGPQLDMDSTVVDSLLRYVGFDKVRITGQGTVWKSDPGIYFDFNAIAKGYAIDRLAKLMDGKGIQNYLIEVGGELIAKGTNTIKEKPWVVGIDDPQAEVDRNLKVLIHLKDRALASSGNYRKFRIDPKTGIKYVHTLDPKTGYTKNSNTLGVTILANTCAIADAYATACMAMDLDDALKLLSRQKELDGYIIYIDTQGETQEFKTKGFEALMVK